MSARHAFPDSLLPSDTVSLSLTSAGLLAEPWEAIEIDERCPIQAPCQPLKASWRSIVAGYRIRRGLAYSAGRRA